MVVLDTNVISALMHEPPLPAVAAWLDQRPRVSIWTTAITVMEIRQGIETLVPSRRRARLQRAIERLVVEKIEHRIAAFDTEAANAAAILMVERQRAGRPGDLRDTMIAGIVIASHATLATRNTRHFADLPVPVIDPWQGAPR
jgi:predicted nucleic acid-binding protein